MVKELRSRNRDQEPRQTLKQSTLRSKETEFLHELSSTDPQVASQTALYNLHLFIKRNKIKNVDRFKKKVQQLLRFCKVCRRFDRLRSIKTCERCEDHYHKNCYGYTMKYVEGKFVCNSCLYAKISLKKCKVCNKYMPENGIKRTCQYCQNDYHSHCMSSDSKICQRCQKVRQHVGVQKKSRKIKKNQREQENIKSTNRNLRDMFRKIQKKKQMIVENSEILIDRKTCSFKALNIVNEEKLINKYKNKLLKVIQEKQMNYNEDLKDIQFHFKNMEEGSMNFGLQGMSQQEEKQYIKYKKQPIGPFTFQFSKKKGYGVIADMDIPKNSIICEYVGEVVTLRECSLLDFVDQNDSEMDLWIGRNSDEKLVIRPQKWTNIARFINGVKDTKSLPNVSSIRLCFRGVPCILLLANRSIKKGQSLCYDYNAGKITAKYNTQNFVE